MRNNKEENMYLGVSQYHGKVIARHIQPRMNICIIPIYLLILNTTLYYKEGSSPLHLSKHKVRFKVNRSAFME